ncbi:MAG: hypothetical protein ACLQBY_18785 [Solirubrobacteraceae bacterium]
MSSRHRITLPLLGLAVVLAIAPAAARAQPGGSPEWHLEQPQPPPPPGAAGETLRPIGLGKIGDIEFRAPNEGLLITAGNPPTIPAGVWFYDGVSWREISKECGGTDGRIAWAGPDEFWTVSDGRPGQAGNEPGKLPPLADNTLCHFAAPAGKLEIVASYATLAFQPTSYQAMHGAGCITPSDCWFAGEPLPRGQRGAFQLHWNGSSLIAEPDPEGHAVEDMVGFEGRLFQGVRLSSKDLITPEEEERFFAGEPSVLHIINPIGAANQFVFPRIGVPRYAPEELPEALDFFHLSADESSLWGAANPTQPLANGAEVTVIRDSEALWTQLIGYGSDPEGKNPFTKFDAKEIEEEPARRAEDELVNSIAAEPGSESAWLALSSDNNAALGPVAPAMVARISAAGTVSERQTLPSSSEAQEGVGPKGAADKVVCPAVEDCWLATTQGWLFHRALESYPEVTDPAYPPLGQPITYRPYNGPQIVPDAPPEDDSGLKEEGPDHGATVAEAKLPPVELKIAAPLLTNLHSRLVHGSTLELRFHLAVKARVRLLAKRRKKVVASTPMRTLAAGSRKLLLRLNPHEWPTSLSLQTHALAPLPTSTVKESVGGPEHASVGSNTVSTGLTVLPQAPSFAGFGFQP